MTVRRFEKKLDKVTKKYRKMLEKRPVRFTIGERVVDAFHDRLWFSQCYAGLNITESRLMAERLDEVRREYFSQV